MITRPSTAQILLDARRELLEVIGPEVSSSTARVSIEMLENVLRNCATRASHEIAWMRDECSSMEAFCDDVVSALGDSAAEVAERLAAYRLERSESLHLDDVQADYDRAGRAMSAAVDVVMASGDRPLAARTAELLAARQAREAEIMGEWHMVGRG